MKLLFPVAILALTSAAQAKDPAPPMEVYLNGEKPGLSKPTPFSDSQPLQLNLARDEFETLIVRLNTGSALTLRTASKVQLKLREEGSPALQLQAYTLGSQHFKRSSYRSGPAGEVVDIVIPNDLAQKPGFKIPKDNVPSHPTFLFEIHVPENAKPGTYTGTLSFAAGGDVWNQAILTPGAQGKGAGGVYQLPVKIRIFSTQLPKTFRLKTSFGYATWGSLKKHYGKWVAGEFELYRKYFRAATEHRIDLHKIFNKALENKAQDPLTAESNPAHTFLAQWTPLREGLTSPYGFRWSTVDLPVSKEQIENPEPEFWKALNAAVVKHGMKNQTFVYFVDEPKDTALPMIAANLKKIRQWAPDLTFLGTLHYRPSLEGTFNAWCPNLAFWETRNVPSPDSYLKRKKEKGDQLWLYTSCNAHGCDGNPDDTYTPDLVTDRPSAYARVFPVMAFRYGADGILYYDTVTAYEKDALSPWKDPFLFGGYGEGNLFYPCTPGICGVEDQEVLVSLRMKTLRDGLEDAELLAMARDKGVPVETWVKELIPGPKRFPQDTASFDKLKVRALEAMEPK